MSSGFRPGGLTAWRRLGANMACCHRFGGCGGPPVTNMPVDDPPAVSTGETKPGRWPATIALPALHQPCLSVGQVDAAGGVPEARSSGCLLHPSHKDLTLTSRLLRRGSARRSPAWSLKVLYCDSPLGPSSPRRRASAISSSCSKALAKSWPSTAESSTLHGAYACRTAFHSLRMPTGRCCGLGCPPGTEPQI